MLTYQIVIEADGVARHVIRHDDLAGKTFAAPGVTVLSQAYIELCKTQYGLADVHEVLAMLGFGDELTEEDLDGIV